MTEAQVKEGQSILHNIALLKEMEQLVNETHFEVRSNSVFVSTLDLRKTIHDGLTTAIEKYCTETIEKLIQDFSEL